MVKQKSMGTKLVFCALALLSTLYCAWSYFFQTGLYALVVRLLSQHLEVYRPWLTILGIWVVLAGLPLFYAFRGKSKHEYQLKHSELSRWLKIKTALLGLATLAVTASALAAYMMSSHAPSDTQPPIQIDISNASDKSLWFQRVTLKGKPITGAAVLTEGSGDSLAFSITRYTPISASGNKREPIKFVEMLSSDSVEQINRGAVSLTGFVLPKSVPVLVRESFKESGLVLADRVYVIGREVYSAQNILMFLSIALGLLALALIVRLLSTPFRNKRKLQDCRDHQGNW